MYDEDAVRQLAEQRRIGDTGPVHETALLVQHPVDVVRRGFRGQRPGRRPGGQKRLVVGVAAFRAGPVPGRQRDRLVEEEQLGVAAGPHDGPPAAAELQHAHQPPADLVAPDQGQVLVVEHPPVAVHGPAVLGRDQLACGRHPIPQRAVQPREPVAVGRLRAFLGHGFSPPPRGRAVWRFPDGIVPRSTCSRVPDLASGSGRREHRPDRGHQRADPGREDRVDGFATGKPEFKRQSEYANQVADSVATNIIVFGRGLIRDEAGYRLSNASAARVATLLAYIDQNKDIFAERHGRVVFSGGWSGAGENLEKPPERFREGSLMLNQATAADIAGDKLVKYAEAFAEVDSDSTLENVLHIVESGYFRGITFTARNPLGLVGHKEHLNRIDYLARKVFNLPRGSVVHIVAPGIDKPGSGIPESLLLQVTRLSFAGASGVDSLRRRERLLVALNRTLPRRTHQP